MSTKDWYPREVTTYPTPCTGTITTPNFTPFQAIDPSSVVPMLQRQLMEAYQEIGRLHEEIHRLKDTKNWLTGSED